MGNAGQHRVLSGGVRELKIDVGPGYRVYYTQRSGVLIVLLAGGDKSTQKQDIKVALALAKNLWETVMAKTKTQRYDVAEHLRTPKEMALYLDACMEESDGDAAFIAKALGDIARAQGMTRVAHAAGLSRESLYKALSGERSPDFSTVLKVAKALGMRLHATAA